MCASPRSHMSDVINRRGYCVMVIHHVSPWPAESQTDITSILHFLLIYVFLSFCALLHSSLLSRASPLLSPLSCALATLSHALLCFLTHFTASPHLPALWPAFPAPRTTFPCSPSVVVPYSLVFHLHTLVPGPLSTFLSI